MTLKFESTAIFCKKEWTSANENDYYCSAFRGTPTENLKARHCSHCFQYYFSQLLLAFFFEVLCLPGLLAISSPGSARAPHVHLVCSGPCALAVNKLPATPTADPVALWCSSSAIRQRIQHSVSSRFALWCRQSPSKGSSHDLTLRIYWFW